MKKEILKLREKMREHDIDIYYVPSGDYHSSEYVNDFFKCREFLTNLTGEAGELLVNSEGAYLWTDARYFIQAETQLEGTGIELMKMAEPGIPTIEEFLEDYASKNKGSVLGFYGKVLPAVTGLSLEKILTKYDVSIKYDKDLVDEVWTDRPEHKATELFELPVGSVGLTAEQKIANIRQEMKEKGADYLLLTDLMETAWLFNLRGSDVAYTPVFFGYTLLSHDDVRLFVMNGAIDGELPERLSFVKTENYEDIEKAVAEIPEDKTLWLDPGSANYSLAKICHKAVGGSNLIEEMTPVAMAKAIKNESEIKSTINAHIKDGAAMVNFISWLKKNVADGKLTEIDAADYLQARRLEQKDCFDISFETISGYGPNGAIIHYAPTEETNLTIKPEGFLLMDSGGQYLDGTTDITRTIAVGPLTDEMIYHYTYVLKSH
ncbi:MAG TPA: M24 family metallopeptidase, partial [Mogibacterium sp.]|nr:M24 family metallopeptidase [Mogibacterium sp.]